MFMNRLLNTDSYKHSRHLAFPPGVTETFSMIESRGGLYNETLFFGLQAFLKEYLSKPLTLDEIIEAEQVCKLHGEPFNKPMFEHILKAHNGRWPIRIAAVREGTVVPNKNVLVTISNTDPACADLPGFLETALLRAVWYPTQVATTSWRIRKLILQYLNETGSPDLIDFKLVDFGARGCSSEETAALGGMAHLVSFKSSDTLSGIMAARRYYKCKMAGFSIPASEHSTMTMLGKDGQAEQFARMIKTFGGSGKVYACVADGYDIYDAVTNIFGDQLKQLILDTGGTLVIRPDSGDPVQVTLAIVTILGEKFGFTINNKNFKVLNSAVRIIQGDGIDENMIDAILSKFKAEGWSADNISFGMGGKLLQAPQRDDNSWAMKCTAACINGKWVDVFKDPVTDKKKQSKRGILSFYKDTKGNYASMNLSQIQQARANGEVWYEQLRTVYENGELFIDEDLDMIRARALS